jgi:eukaryotic-like serine/threonine-protein kinase
VANPENLSIPPAIGRYRLYGIIAAGGMATVHYGRMHGQLGFARTVAGKRRHREYARDPEFVAMFMDEARLAARVHHPNVVQTLDVVASDGELFLVMEYLPAVSLSQLFVAVQRRGERAPAAVAVAIVSDVLRGLHAAHEATDEDGDPLDIVHRDVSPQNVLVGADGVARVLDFGIAKATGRASQVTREGQVKGKFAYMAPEQVTNVGVGRQSDVFAASIVLWEVLTGQRLFQAESEPALLAAVLSGPIRAPSSVAAELGPEIDRVVLRGLARDLSVRYASGRDMALDLEAHAVLASPSQVGKWVESLAGDDLARRAARVTEIESESRSVRVSAASILATPSEAPAEPSAGPSVAMVSTKRRHLPAIATFAAAIVGALGVGLGVRSARTAPSRAPDVPTVQPSARESAPPSALSPHETTPPPREGADPAMAPSPPPRSVRATPRPAGAKAPPTRSAGSPAPSSACDPPYYADSQGHLVYKPECFR